ncbi:CHAT domain-containing protein [Amycolatopsis echigonensis]|uniref:CHAT domain-containing protein n=1 Tax=Amycolatopsis echigonensis TaxID=2576905 RepID=A0A2N3WJH6_9PSEU|nr:CHAT domain-containing protein [Amycolatopsis niigatensis]PKV94018.1 CHAT domain-containing protein [Amycolatopsis niigatensis]
MSSDLSADSSQLVDRRMALAREWDELVDQVRQIPGFEDFLRAPRLEALLPAARCGPVVVVNVSRYRCDAIIVTTEGVEVEELADLTAADVEQRTGDYLRVLQVAEQAVWELFDARRQFDDGDRSPASIRRYTAAKHAYIKTQGEMEAELGAVAEWLWDCIADPVLTKLGFADTPQPGRPFPRLWWCPTGLLNLLPLHAAGYHGSSEHPPRTVLDRVVSSYTPTLRALLDASRATDVPPDDQRMLIVAVHDVADQVPLQAVAGERDLLTRLFTDRYTLLESDAATWEKVRSELPRHCWVHFSCHGGQDLTDPSRGGLLLHDRTLTVGDVSSAQYHGEFAFLSACKTATGGVTLADEVITLAAALHYTGYRHVIGTLWSVYDNSAGEIAETVYSELTSSGEFSPSRSAYALHTAIKRLRDADHSRLSAWMPFAHTGP